MAEAEPIDNSVLHRRPVWRFSQSSTRPPHANLTVSYRTLDNPNGILLALAKHRLNEQGR